jgi:ABC-2 type transport system permease protein
MRSEWIKIVSVRTWFALSVAVVAICALGAQIMTMPIADGVWVAMPQHPFLGMFTVLMAVIAYVMGARTATDEFAHGTAVWTALASPSRWRTVLAKAGVAGTWAAVSGAIAMGGATAFVLAWASSNGDKVSLSSADALPLVGWTAVVTGLYAMIGVGVGSAMRQQVATLVGGVAWILIGESALSAVLKDAARFLPGDAAAAVFGVPTAELLGRGAALAVLSTYAVIAMAAGIVISRRRDIV